MPTALLGRQDLPGDFQRFPGRFAGLHVPTVLEIALLAICTTVVRPVVAAYRFHVASMNARMNIAATCGTMLFPYPLSLPTRLAFAATSSIRCSLVLSGPTLLKPRGNDFKQHIFTPTV